MMYFCSFQSVGVVRQAKSGRWCFLSCLFFTLLLLPLAWLVGNSRYVDRRSCDRACVFLVEEVLCAHRPLFLRIEKPARDPLSSSVHLTSCFIQVADLVVHSRPRQSKFLEYCNREGWLTRSDCFSNFPQKSLLSIFFLQSWILIYSRGNPKNL